MMGTHTLRGKAFPWLHAIPQNNNYCERHVDWAQQHIIQSHMWMHQIETMSKNLCTPNLHQIIYTPHGITCGIDMIHITPQMKERSLIWCHATATTIYTRVSRVRKRDKRYPCMVSVGKPWWLVLRRKGILHFMENTTSLALISFKIPPISGNSDHKLFMTECLVMINGSSSSSNTH